MLDRFFWIWYVDHHNMHQQQRAKYLSCSWLLFVFIFQYCYRCSLLYSVALAGVRFDLGHQDGRQLDSLHETILVDVLNSRSATIRHEFYTLLDIFLRVGVSVLNHNFKL